MSRWASSTGLSRKRPPPRHRYTNVDFRTGLYDGQGIDAIFEAHQSDARLSSWGGTDPHLYDSWGMSTDTTQRVHLKSTLPRLRPDSRYASWQEIRSTDGPWQADAPTLAKSSLNISEAATWGPGGFSMGAKRWFAFDYLLPLNVNGVSYEFVNGWNGLMDLHPSESSSGGTLVSAIRPESGNPRYHRFLTTPNPLTSPYRVVNLVRLTNADGSRVASAYNTWHELVIGIKASDLGSVGNSPGWIEVWHDGVNVMSRQQRPSVLAGESGPYAQMQNYTPYPTPFVGGAIRSAIAYGGFRAGLTRADVQTRWSAAR